jgi:hypothetical protein
VLDSKSWLMHTLADDENSLTKQLKVRAPIHTTFTEVAPFHTLLLDERSSGGASIRLSLTDVVANG